MGAERGESLKIASQDLQDRCLEIHRLAVEAKTESLERSDFGPTGGQIVPEVISSLKRHDREHLTLLLSNDDIIQMDANSSAIAELSIPSTTIMDSTTHSCCIKYHRGASKRIRSEAKRLNLSDNAADWTLSQRTSIRDIFAEFRTVPPNGMDRMLHRLERERAKLSGVSKGKTPDGDLAVVPAGAKGRPRDARVTALYEIAREIKLANNNAGLKSAVTEFNRDRPPSEHTTYREMKSAYDYRNQAAKKQAKK